jgi:hypothetical protein
MNTQFSVGKPERKSQLGRPRRKWKDIITVNSVGMCGLEASSSRQGAVAGTCEHGNKPSGSIKGGEFLDSFSRRAVLHAVS